MAKDHGSSVKDEPYEGFHEHGMSKGSRPIEDGKRARDVAIAPPNQRDMVLASVLAGIPASVRRNGTGEDREGVERL